MKSKGSLFFLLILALVLMLLMPACQSPEDTRSRGYGSIQKKPLNTPLPPVGEPTVEKVPIGSFSSKILDKEKNRVNNITLAVNGINNKIVEPGEVFSFNNTIGRRTEEKGYKKARIILRGKKSRGRGGGICQVSSTLYNAVEAGDLEIVERHHHSRQIYYIPKGKDATVVYGVKDFKFRNNRPYPVMITAKVENNMVLIDIYEIKS